MASDLIELSADVAALRVLTVISATKTLVRDGIPPESLIKFAEGLVEQTNAVEVPAVQNVEMLGRIKSLNADAIMRLFTEVAESMRVATEPDGVEGVTTT